MKLLKYKRVKKDYKMRFTLIVLSIFLFSSCDFITEKFFSQKDDKVSTESEKTQTGDSTAKNGEVRSLFPNGKLKSIVNYKDNIKVGISKTFYETGEKQYEIPYVNGKKHGLVKWFYKSGKLYRLTTFVHGVKQGIQKKYWEGGKLKSEILFDNNRMCSGLKEYTNSGKQKTTPRIVIKHVNLLKETGMYHLELSLDNSYKSVQFFIGELEDGKCFPLKVNKVMNELETRKGKAVFKFSIPKGHNIDREIPVVARVKSPYLNYYILSAKANVSVRNPN